MNTDDFRELLYEKGRELYRDMPWRRDTRPYYVLVSELMLQQTQVDRVVPKFEAFIARFPSEVELAQATLGEVLAMWSGLGYNRRAKFLHEAAKMIEHDLGGAFPNAYDQLIRLPGVGVNTAGALLAYAFNRPALFIETNVRTVYFHHFFEDGDTVADSQVKQVLDATLDKENPREFYWALMDYGSWLKRSGAGRIQQSRHYKKQSALKGSVREVRGLIIKALTQAEYTKSELAERVPHDDRFEPALESLMKDGLVMETSGQFHLTK